MYLSYRDFFVVPIGVCILLQRNGEDLSTAHLSR